MISRVLPYPLLTVSLIIFWMTINSFSAGHLLLGTGVALIASWAMASLRSWVVREVRPRSLPAWSMRG